MFKKIYFNFAQALENIRSNFFHTLLSILGIVIGVAALVAILSLIDGMEKFAKDQISNTTDLKNIMIRTQTHRTINNIRIKKDTFDFLNFQDWKALQETLKNKTKSHLYHRQTSELEVQALPKTIAATVIGVTPKLPGSEVLSAGRNFTQQDYDNHSRVTIINHALAKLIIQTEDESKLIGRTIRHKDLDLVVIGIVKESHSPALFIPFTIIPENIFKQIPPEIMVESASVEEVPELKTQINNWLANRYPGKMDFEIITNDFRVKQVVKSFMLFRIVMGLIVGISVLVGGVGIMNILLMSVTQRTAEIGIRKAMGANRADIIRLFLAESITLSLFGSLLGLGLGMLMTSIFIPIIKAFTEISFHAVYSWNTLLTIVIIAIVIGIVFGTYPARRAALLNPVVAIHRE